MEASSSGIDWRTRSNLCRCCLSPGCYKDLSTEYFCSGQREVYADMLKDTFNIEISYQEGAGPSSFSRLICEVCILHLRDAAAFKQQAVNCEASIVAHFTALRSQTKEPQTTSAANVNMNTLVKNEDSWDGDLIIDESLNMEECDSFDFNDDADELLANVKLETAKEPSPPAEERPTLCTQKPLRKYKARTEEGNKPKDLSKILERRGIGPILRDNSLQLLAHSSAAVFQWSRGWYRCFCCQEPFSDMTTLRQHTATHTLKNIERQIILQQNRLIKVEITDLYCKICSKNLTDLPELRHHLTDSHNIKFLKTEDLLVPFRLSTELKCQICAEEFTTFRMLNIHMNKHYQKQVCHICGAGFANLAFLNLHKTRSHRAPKCSKCNREFANRLEKKQHEFNEHGLKRERKFRFPCPFCNERFVQENFKVKHMVEKHGMVKPEHRCNQCSKTFLTKSLKNNHIKNVHFKEKRDECNVCHSRFYSKSDLSRHMVTHTGEKNYECNVCHHVFSTKDSMKRHRNRTHGNIEFGP